MKKLILGIALASVGALAIYAGSRSAWAGVKNPYAVYINTTDNYANGTLAGTYRSSNSVEYIGCYTARGTSPSAYTSGYCSAKNSAGTVRTCSTTDSTMLATIRSLNSTSYVEFYWGGTTCIDIYVHNASNHM